ncbi:MAG TPA: DUF5107 domain-containing protein [Prolixibacteraceae bacterium]|nr:DUF5107 domain-containing protein [Prolixibacteraceae bacterium]
MINDMSVNAWCEKVTIPTYGIGKPEKNPIFLEKRVYQGSSGAVYPHPVIEKIMDEKIDTSWNAVFIENQYLKIMILPELGGRIQMAYDKTKERHFVYYNQVIKPALVGLTGPWISGGIEFNWPQHHRPSTYEPVDHLIEENPDGSVTVWCNEVERMFRTRGMHGFTLYPDKAYLEIKVKLYNRTNQAQTFLWWANPAVKVNDHYQSVFPPDVNAVFDHGKRDVSEFPIAKGTYYKVDYSPGTDISRYKNIPVPTSYMAVNSKYNFVGGYENDSNGGLLHVANHHVSPGKKQWTWGHGDFGQAWDRNLTDEDGPYIELMCGVYTDNQPDFSWIMPGEEKTFSQYFMPYRDLGVVKNATKEAIVNMEVNDGKVTVKAYTLAAYPAGKVIVRNDRELLLEDTFDFHPHTSYEKEVVCRLGFEPRGLEVTILSAEGKVLVGWKADDDSQREIPQSARAAKLPHEIESNDQLYLTGVHLEQYRHATYDPADYYGEALRRDPRDSRCNNAMGLLLLKKGKFREAEAYFRKAIDTLTERNPNPVTGEPLYHLGLALRLQGKDAEAYDVFYKSVWNDAYMATGYFQLAQLECEQKNYAEALELVERSLIRNWHHHKARQLKVSILRKLGRIRDAQRMVEESLSLDPFNYGILYEKKLLSSGKALVALVDKRLRTLMRDNIHTYIEFALDFGMAGLWDEAIQLISIGIEEQQGKDVYPMALYYKAWMEAQKGDKQASANTLEKASVACPDYCFPNQLEAVMVLEWAKEQNPRDAKAPYYLGNFWYHARQYEDAVLNWERSTSLEDHFPTVHRNLALAYYNKQKQPQKALEALEKAFELDQSDARVLMELDQLYKKLGKDPKLRLEKLEKHLALVMERDDLYLEYATLFNVLGHYEKAMELIMARKFHPWEGGEGKVTGQYVVSLTEMARKAIALGEYEKAVELLNKARTYPENLGEGKLYGAQENPIFYFLGCAYEGMQQQEQAQACWQLASEGLKEPAPAIFYNDQQPDTIYYQGLSLLKLKQKDKARERFEKLIEFGQSHLNDTFQLDYFAVSLPDLQIWEEDLTRRNYQNCLHLIELGKEGMKTND